MPTLIPKQWLIRSTQHDAYWTTEPPEGWTHKSNATRFLDAEKANTKLPQGGTWEPL